MRINKYLAGCGLGSRRSVENIVLQGRVKVNITIVKELSFDVNVDNDAVFVDGKKVQYITNYTYIIFNKPKGCICSTSDEKDRKTIYDYLDIDKGIHSVGRLDYDTEGLLVLTNDGDLHFRLTHPSNEIPKTYLVKIAQTVPEPDLVIMRKGVELDGIMTKRCKIKLKEIEKDGTASYLMTITEGRNRQIRRMFETVGHEVIFLKRIAIGDLKLGGLGRGKFRYLKDDEIYYLKRI